MKWIIYYSIAILLGILFAIFQWPFWLALGVLAIISIGMVIELLYTLYGTTNTKRVEKLVLSKQKEPLYKFIYTQGFGTKEEQITAIDGILKKYKQPHIHHYYHTIQLMLKDNLGMALEEAEKIQKEPLMSYTKALILATMGNEKEALDINLPKEWMKEAIFATIAHNKKDVKTFEHHVTTATNSTKGIQRLSLIYSFNEMRHNL